MPRTKKASKPSSSSKVAKKKTKKKKITRRKVIPRLPKKKKIDDSWADKNRYSPQLLRGMKDILPAEQPARDYLLKKLIDLANAYGFEKIITPVLEESKLFKKSTGLDTDVVEKQMYQFTDLGGKKIVLRPEFTPSVVRAYIEHGMFNLPQPLKFFYWGPAFRYERPQSGRYRQFYQFGLEVLGSNQPLIDAEIILFSQTFFNDLNLPINIQINSLGCAHCRSNYREELLNYLQSHKKSLCPDCQKRLEKNPLRILDCKNLLCQEIVSRAPQLINFLCKDCEKHFTKVLECLDEANVVYQLNPYLVRGLDYYTRTVFEIWPVIDEKEKKEKTNLSALGGGGRYDTLIESLGGRETPAAGLSYGLERILQEMEVKNVRIYQSRGPQVFFAQIGESAARHALRIFNELQSQGIKVAESFGKTSLKAQMKVADDMGVKLTLILGHQEVKDKTIIIRNMKTGNQEHVDVNKLAKEIKKRLK
ncbi:histidine--tRNA ligase [Patescibacteria group bacterium]|nr:histidine--tRNA ligase [Patescibacteria group bacterium]